MGMYQLVQLFPDSLIDKVAIEHSGSMMESYRHIMSNGTPNQNEGEVDGGITFGIVMNKGNENLSPDI